MDAYASSFFAGFVIAAGALACSLGMTVLIGRWVTGDESVFGLVARSLLLLALTAAAFTQLGSVWYFLLLGTLLFPLVEVSFGAGLSGGWIRARQQRRVGEAAVAAADRPTSAVAWLQYGRALLESGRVGAGLAALEEARQLSDADSRTMIGEMVEQAREELLVTCPRCKCQNPGDAQVCRRCLRSLSEDPVVRALAFLARPALRFLLPSPGA